MVIDFNIPPGLEHQCQFWEDSTDQRELAIVGPLGTGKTLSLFIKLALLSLHNHPLPTALVIPDFPTFDKIHRREWPPLGQKYGAPIEIVGAQNPSIKWPWESESLVYSAAKWETIVGTNLAAAAGDEPAVWPVKAYTKITDRIRHPDAKVRQLALTGSPEGVPSWLADKFDIFEVIIDELTGWSRRTIRATQWHPTLAHYPKRLAATYGSSPAEFASYAQGLFVPLYEGRCYPSFNRHDHCRSLEYRDCLPLVISADFNVAAMRWEIWQFSPTEIRFIDEIALGIQGSVPEAADLVVERWRHHKGPVWLTGDATGKSRTASTGRTCYDEALPILRATWPHLVEDVPAANPPVSDRVRTVNHHLRGVSGLAVLIDEQRCPELVSDLEQNVWKPGSADIKKDNDGPGALRTHAGDAAGYGIYARFPIVRPMHVHTATPAEAEEYHDSILGAQF